MKLISLFASLRAIFSLLKINMAYTIFLCVFLLRISCLFASEASKEGIAWKDKNGKSFLYRIDTSEFEWIRTWDESELWKKVTVEDNNKLTFSPLPDDFFMVVKNVTFVGIIHKVNIKTKIPIMYFEAITPSNHHVYIPISSTKYDYIEKFKDKPVQVEANVRVFTDDQPIMIQKRYFGRITIILEDIKFVRYVSFNN